MTQLDDNSRCASFGRGTVIPIVVTAVLLSIACSGQEASTAATSDNLAGVWIQQCTTKQRSDTSCAAQDKEAFRYELFPDGKLRRTLNDFDACTTASWSLVGSELTFVCRGGGMELKDIWSARLVNDRLILFHDRLGGRVLAREGSAAPRPSGVFVKETLVARTLRDVSYQVRIPSGYFLAEETVVSDRFDPADDAGISFRFKYGSVARPVGERGSCVGYDDRLSRDDDGAMRVACVDKASGVFSLSCWAQRDDKGSLTDEQFALAAEVCGSVRLH